MRAFWRWPVWERFMNEMPLSPLRLLLLGYGHVAQALLPLLASRGDWLAAAFGIRPVISGIATRRQGYFIHHIGIDAAPLAAVSAPLNSFRSEEHTSEL